MENLTALFATAQPSLLLLNEYCLLELFDLLKFEDSMNLAETCVYLCAVANRTFRKYSTMTLDYRMVKNGKQCIDRFFTRFGHRVLSLGIYFTWGTFDLRIVRNCENLKILKMSGISSDFGNGPSLLTIDNLEVLSFERCNSKFIKSFLNIVRKVIALSVGRCGIQCNVLMTMLRNSPDMENFQWRWNGTFRFDFPLLEIISNVERLCLGVEVNNVSELDPLLKLNRLSKLILTCPGKNITRFLSELAKKGIIQELELRNVAFDENFFEMLQSFDSLQLLVLDDGYATFSELKSSIVWPPKLKRFRFEGFKFTFDAFVSTVKQLKYLESICFNYCKIPAGEKDNFNDMQKLSQQILAAIDDSERKQRLNVSLPCRLKFKEGSSKKFLHDSERLRIHNHNYVNYNEPEIGIHFPGMEL